jgi:dihydroflavonol-4-reductase
MLAWAGVTWKKADLLDIYDVEEVLSGVAEIYHCAAIVSFNPARKDEIIHVNTEITANLVNAAIDADVRKMVHISSVASLGRTGSTKEITEEAQWEESNLNSGYAESKYGAEMEVWRIIGEGLDAVILNPGIILGEPLTPHGWDDGSARLMQTAYKEFPFYTDGVTAFVDVADVVRAAMDLMRSDVTAERFILSAGNFPFREIFDCMADTLGRRRPRFHAGSFATGLVWRWSALKRLFTGRSSVITRETARNAQIKSFYKADKITAALPQFAYTPMDATINRMAKAYLSQCVA